MPELRPVRPSFRVAIACLVAAVASSPSLAGTAPQEAEPAPARTIGLSEAVKIARARNPLATAERLRVDDARFNVRRARAVRRPDVRLDFGTGLVPEARGDAFESPDEQTDLDGLGPFYRVDFDVTLPLLTFGKIGSAVDAAEQGVEAQEAGRERILDRLSVRVARAYWGVLAAERGLRIVEDVDDKYELLIEEVTRRAQDDAYDTDAVDVFEAESNRYEIEQSRLDAAQDRDLAYRGLKSLLYYGWQEPLQLVNQDAPRVELSEEDAAGIVEIAVERHPDLRRLRAAAGAAAAAADAALAKTRPTIALNGFFSYAHAGNRTDQRNPFVVDNFNYRSLGWFVGLRWNLNVDRHLMERSQARIRRDAFLAQAAALQEQVSLDAYQAYRTVVRNAALVEAARASRVSAEDGLRVSLDLWETGIGQVFRLLRLYERTFRLQRLEVVREYEFHVAVAELALAMGDFDLYLQWLEAGRVSLP